MEKHQARDNVAEAHSCVTLSPNNLEPIRGYLLAGAGALCVPEERYREDCSFAAPSSNTGTHPPGQRWYCILVEVLLLLKESGHQTASELEEEAGLFLLSELVISQL